MQIKFCPKFKSKLDLRSVYVIITHVLTLALRSARKTKLTYVFGVSPLSEADYA